MSAPAYVSHHLKETATLALSPRTPHCSSNVCAFLKYSLFVWVCFVGGSVIHYVNSLSSADYIHLLKFSAHLFCGEREQHKRTEL